MGGKSALLKRLPLLAAVALGLWLWQSDLFPQERQLVWTLPNDAPVLQRLEIQIWSDGELLKREELFPSGPLTEVRQSLVLREGEYRVEAYAYPRGAAKAAIQRWSAALRVGGARSYGEVLEPSR